MIISASRRTDIPAFYAEWFMNRIRAGYCTVPNPFNRNQVSYVSLRPEDIEVIVFWTRNPRPLSPYLPELTQLGYRYYFQYTIVDNPREIDTRTPPLSTALHSFVKLAEAIGPEKVIWRYDPIVFSQEMGAEFHISKYRQIANALRGSTRRSVISIVDLYRKAGKRLEVLKQSGIDVRDRLDMNGERFAEMMRAMAQIAQENGMEISSCAEVIDLAPSGIRPGKCIDDELIKRIFHLTPTDKKDPSQREACGCVTSKDIGMYDTCLFGCQYCYATSSFERSRANHEAHDPHSPSLIGWYEGEPETRLL